jgi:hypothetical protein
MEVSRNAATLAAKHELDGKHRGIVIFGSKAAKALSTAPSKGATFAGYLT